MPYHDQCHIVHKSTMLTLHNNPILQIYFIICHLLTILSYTISFVSAHFDQYRIIESNPKLFVIENQR